MTEKIENETEVQYNIFTEQLICADRDNEISMQKPRSNMLGLSQNRKTKNDVCILVICSLYWLAAWQ